MNLPNLVDIFSKVCARDNGALLWGNPEPWIHAELYAEFNAQAQNSGWIPFREEIPYVTCYPVQKPKATNRDWKTVGAVKYADSCLRTATGAEWLWLECKVRHANWNGLDEKKASRDALNAYRKDIVALLGFDLKATADTWEKPDSYTGAYWFESVLRPHTKELLFGTHHFFSAFIQLGSSLDRNIWSEEKILRQVNSWKANQCKERGETFQGSDDLPLVLKSIGNHWLVLAGS